MILVTGGAGYIGSHTCIALIEEGQEIIIADNFINSSSLVIKRIETITQTPVIFFKGDVRDEDFLISIFSKFRITDVIHFAGLKAVSASCKDPLSYYDNNVIGALVLLKVMRASNCKNLVFSSSAAVYGIPFELPVKETSRLLPINPYGQSKLIIEDVLNDLYRSDESWNIGILRYFNPVGAHESALIGEAPNDPPSNLLPMVSQVAGGLRESLTIFGGDYPTHDGTGVRDYIHVTDLVNGHVSALNMFSESGGIFTVNLGTGVGYSVLDVINEFEKVSGRSISYLISDRRPGDSAECYADVTYANSLMCWAAKHKLTQMCEDQWRWQCKNIMECSTQE